MLYALLQTRLWIRCKARAITGVNFNFKEIYVANFTVHTDLSMKSNDQNTSVMEVQRFGWQEVCVQYISCNF